MNPISSQKTLRKCAFVIFLLLGAFTFSGFAIQSHPEANRTLVTLVVKSDFEHSKGISYYAKTIVGRWLRKSRSLSVVGLDRLHSHSVKTLLVTRTSGTIPRRESLVYHIKSLPQNTDGKPAII